MFFPILSSVRHFESHFNSSLVRFGFCFTWISVIRHFEELLFFMDVRRENPDHEKPDPKDQHWTRPRRAKKSPPSPPVRVQVPLPFLYLCNRTLVPTLYAIQFDRCKGCPCVAHPPPHLPSKHTLQTKDLNSGAEAVDRPFPFAMTWTGLIASE